VSTQRDLSPDFRNPEICAFLKNAAQQEFDEAIADTATRLMADYERDPAAPRQIFVRNMVLRTFMVTKCDLFTRAGRLVQTHDVVDPVDHNLTMNVRAILFVRPQLTADQKLEIRTAFQNTALTDAAINDIETHLIQSGLRVDDFQVDLCMVLTKVDNPVFSTLNVRTFESQVSACVDATGQPRYAMQVHEAVHTCDLPDFKFDDSSIVIVADVDHPEAEIRATENAAHRECDGLEVTDHRIGTAFQYYEWKIEWEIRPIRIGPCEIMRTKIPIVYSRIRKEALWCYAMTTAELKRNVERAIVGCLEAAAVDTAVLAIVTGGLGLAAAAEAFANSFLTCFENKVEDGVRCIFTSLKLVAERGDWQEKVF
jgi:hypothetical protein